MPLELLYSSHHQGAGARSGSTENGSLKNGSLKNDSALLLEEPEMAPLKMARSVALAAFML